MTDATFTSTRSQTGGLAAFGNRILETFAAAMERDGRMKKVARLQAMSDAELAARGLRREDILRHVFHAFYYV